VVDRPACVVGRQERGRSAVEARRQIREIVGPELTRVRQYQARALASVGRDDDEDRNSIHTSDVVLCARLLNASVQLPWWRQLLVTRRLRKLFGPNTVGLCRTHGKQAEDPKGVMGVLINRQAMGSRYSDENLPQPDKGSFDQALRCPPNSKAVAELVRSLSLLSRGR
jgi:hypothetical protein